MKPKIRTKGMGYVQTMLRNVALKVPDIAHAQMKRSAARVVELAQLMVPEDTGALRDSIRIEKSYGTRGRLQIDIIAGGKTITTASGRQIDLDRYARLVHEAYETQVAPNGPGPKTAAKMQAYPQIQIGSGFLFRAMEKERASFERVMVEAINQVVRTGR